VKQLELFAAPPVRRPPAPAAAGARPTPRAEALLATLAAGVALSAMETVYALAQGWNHPPEYLGLSAGLTLLLALAVGLACALVRMRAGWALAAWVAAGATALSGWPAGLACALAALAASALWRGTRSAPLVLGTSAALALACAWLEGASVAEHLGREGELPFEILGTALVLALVLGAQGFVLARLPARVGTAPGAALLLLAGLGCAASPWLDAPDGRHRLPPPGYAQSGARVAGDGRAHVFLLVLDTVRADHLSVYGYARETTPELDRLVQTRDNALVYRQAFANGTWTVPSHASLFTGRLPAEHGAHFALDGSVRYGFGIADELTTLAESLQSSGYATLAGYANHWLRSVHGMGRGFDRYLRSMERDALPFVGEALRARYLPGLCWGATKGGARADEVNATLLSMIEHWSEGPNPLFVFANYGDAHGPYAPPAPFRGKFAPWDHEERAEHLSLALSSERRAVLEARYDEELAYLDHELGRLFRELDRLGLLDTSWIFVTADHGEAFGEHGALEHGTTVYNEVTHVPLIVFPPEGQSLAADEGPVSLVDVAATIAAIGGGTLGGPGRDLRAPAPLEAPAAIEFYGDPVKAARMGELARRPARAVVLGRYKLIALPGPLDSGEELFLYDLERDEGEQVNLARALPIVVEHLRAFLPEFGAPTFSSDGEAPEPETLEDLRAMGYAGAVTE